MMRRPIGADQTGAVERKDHGQILQGHVMKNVVNGPLHETGINANDRPQTAAGHAGRAGDGVFLGNAHVKGAARKFLLELDQPRPFEHRRGHGHDGGILARLGKQGLRQKST